MIVVGLGFGDEGKGLTTSFLCSQTKNPLVVRFNGGHQAGHTVVHKGERHVFSSFGSGTLQGAPTYWSKYCTFYPTGFLAEWETLTDHSLVVYVNPLCPVTTPYDVQRNISREKMYEHGSVGVGFGTTIQRQKDNYKIFVQDLYCPKVLRAKLENISKHYGNFGVDVEPFINDCQQVLNRICVIGDEIMHKFGHQPILEGAQGILLDQNFGFFPNVTRSNTTSENAFALYPKAEEVFYVTRCYQTRHGNGFMTNEEEVLNLINNENETNIQNEFQGKFRVSPIDPNLLNYALMCDSHYVPVTAKKYLMITCVDQLPDFDAYKLLHQLNTKFEKVFISKGPSYENTTTLK